MENSRIPIPKQSKLQSKRKVPEQKNENEEDYWNWSVPAFLLKTYEILLEPRNSEIVSWNDAGTAFIVKKPNEFSQTILPHYFKHSNFASFVRQLNMYDFHKAKENNCENCFWHPMFQRDAKHLLRGIKRKITGGIADGPDENLDTTKKNKAAGKDIQQLMSSLQEKHDELEIRMNDLEKKNKDYAAKYLMLINECYRMNEKNIQLEKLVHCLTSMLAVQGSGYRELTGPGNTENPPGQLFKNESIMVIRKMLAETIKALSLYSPGFDPSMFRGKTNIQLPNHPMLESSLPPQIIAPSKEDLKEDVIKQKIIQQAQKPYWPKQGQEAKENGNFSPHPMSENNFESMQASSPYPNMNSPLPPSGLVSPARVQVQDPGMNVEPFPRYLFELSPLRQPIAESSSHDRLDSFDAHDKKEAGISQQIHNQAQQYNNTAPIPGRRVCAEVETISSHSEGSKIIDPSSIGVASPPRTMLNNTQNAMQLYSYALQQFPPPH